MSSLIQCDKCGTTTPDDFPLGWLCVTQMAAVPQFGERDSPLHFCSWVCLSGWGTANV